MLRQTTDLWSSDRRLTSACRRRGCAAMEAMAIASHVDSNEESIMRNTLITILGTILVPSILHVLFPSLILQGTSGLDFPKVGIIEILSIIVAAIGISMVVWVSATFVRRGRGTAVPLLPPTKFVSKGLYRYVRNPMYVGLLLVIIAEAIFFRSIWLLVYGSLIWLAAHIYVVLIEEPNLGRRFGATYEEYLVTTPRWIPRLPRQKGT